MFLLFDRTLAATPYTALLLIFPFLFFHEYVRDGLFRRSLLRLYIFSTFQAPEGNDSLPLGYRSSQYHAYSISLTFYQAVLRFQKGSFSSGQQMFPLPT